MSVPKPEAPFEPAEAVFESQTQIPAGLSDRWFLIYTEGREYGYWHASGSGYHQENRNLSGPFSYHRAASSIQTVGGGIRTRAELLPLPMPELTEPNDADRDISYGGLGKVEATRKCLIKDKEGKYYDGNLKEVAERKLAPIHRVDKLYGLDMMKPFTFELLQPRDALTGGPGLKEVVCYAEAMRQEDNARFLVRHVKSNEQTGYVYFSNVEVLPTVSRSKAHMLDKKELRRRFDDVPKAEIIIEQLVPQPISKLEDFFNASAIQLLKVAPNNENVRGFMLSKLKVMPPKEADTFDKLKEWIEWNVSKASTKPMSSVEEWNPEILTPAPVTVADVGVQLEVKRRRMAYGKCTYSIRESGTDAPRLTIDELRELAAQSSTWGNFRNKVRDWIHTEEDDQADYNDEGDYEYSDYDHSDTDNHETLWVSTLRTDEALRGFMREYLPEHNNRLI